MISSHNEQCKLESYTFDKWKTTYKNVKYGNELTMRHVKFMIGKSTNEHYQEYMNKQNVS